MNKMINYYRDKDLQAQVDELYARMNTLEQAPVRKMKSYTSSYVMIFFVQLIPWITAYAMIVYSAALFFAGITSLIISGIMVIHKMIQIEDYNKKLLGE